MKKLLSPATATAAVTAGIAFCCAISAPSVLAQSPFANCKPQQEVKSASVSIRAYECPNARLVVDRARDRFELVTKEPTGEQRRVVLRTFTKPADAGIENIVSDVRKQSPGPQSATCTLQPARDSRGRSDKSRFVFGPTGAAQRDWDVVQKSGGKSRPPCGALGVQFVGDLYFMEVPDDPSTVVFLDMGSEIQIYDPATLKSLKPLDCANPKTTSETNACGFSDEAKSDAALNIVYKKALAKIAAGDGTPGNATAWAAALRGSQRAWLNWRDADCQRLVPMFTQGGSATTNEVLGCLTKKTEMRTKEVREYFGLE